MLVCRADQSIGPGSELGDSSDPAENCESVSSDIHVLDRHVHIFYKFMFYKYNDDGSLIHTAHNAYSLEASPK
jgi:hypothetical protein